MAIILHELVPGDTFGLDNDGGHDHTLTYYVEVNRAADAGLMIAMDTRTPKRSQVLPLIDPLAWVSKIQITQSEDSWRIWEVVVTLEEIPYGKKNPFSRPDEITFRGQTSNGISFRDADGHMNINRAGDMFNPPPTFLKATGSVLVARKIPKVPNYFIPYYGAINSDEIVIRGLTFPKHTLMMTSFEIGNDDEEENSIPFASLQFELKFDPDTWEQFIPNRGYREMYEKIVPDYDADPVLTPNLAIVEGSYPQKKIWDTREILIDGEKPSDPVWLDAKGRAYRQEPAAEPPLFTPPASAPPPPMPEIDPEPEGVPPPGWPEPLPVDVNLPIRTLLKPNEMLLIRKFMQRRLPFARLKIRKD